MTDRHGLAVITGNLVLVLIVALLWAWESVAQENDFARCKRHRWEWWWAVPLAVVALLAPVDAGTMEPDFTLGMLTNEAGLTCCMMTPVVLAVLTLSYPKVNLAVMRVTGFVGMVLGLVNMVVWFLLEPWGWWMGVMHIPLLVLSLYAFVLGQGRSDQASPMAAKSER